MPGFKRGDLILKCSPYAYTLNDNERGKRCDNCFQLKDSLKRCSQCTFLYFCDEDCQRKAWAYHKDECKSIKKIKPHEPTPSFRLLAQILYRIKRDGYNEPAEMAGTYRRSFADLESHAKEIKNNPKDLEKISSYIEGLHDYMSAEDIPEFEKMIEIFGKMVVNTFSIWNYETKSIGGGLYLGASIFDHSCEPNAEVVFDGITINIRAICDIEDNDLRKVYISYISPRQLTEDRQKLLQEQYYFQCQCKRCTDPTIENLMRKLVSDTAAARDVEKRTRETLEKLKTIHKADKPSVVYDIAMDALAEQEGFLSSTHLYHVLLLDYVFDSSILLGRWPESLSVAYELEKPYRLYFGEYNPHYCLLVIKMGKIELLLNQNDKAEKHFLQAEKCCRVCHGVDHPLYLELKKLLHQCQQEMMFSNSADCVTSS